MGMPQAAPNWTAALVRALPDDGKRYEVVDGELLVTPSPRSRHQRAVALLYRAIAGYVEAEDLGEALFSPADIELDPRTLVQPDVFVHAGIIRDWNDGTPLLLAVEVLSPSTARPDRTTKRRRYQQAGIPEYWIVDMDARVIERWRPGDDRPEILAERMAWQPQPGVAGFVLELPGFFAKVNAEG